MTERSRRRAGYALSAALALAAPAAAELVSRPGANDARIRVVDWRENDVVRLETALKHVTAVEFGRGERIASILAGDSASFQIVALQSGDVVSVKPLVEGARTNLVIYTTKRRYAFDLRAVAGSRRLAHRIIFQYPDPDPAAAFLPAALEGSRDYHAAGEAAFRPVEAWDDGVNTFLRFDPAAPRPAIFAADAEGLEYATNSVQIDATLVQIEGVSPRLVLRLGAETVAIWRGPPERTSGAAWRAPLPEDRDGR